MTFHVNNSWRRLLNAALVSGLLVAGAVGISGCEKSPEEQLLAAKMAVINSKPDVAEKHLEPVLKGDPDSFEGLRLMASVKQLRGEFAAAEESFLALQKAQGFDVQGEAAQKLSTKQKSQKELLERDLIKLYTDWANAVDPAEDMATFEQVARKGLAISPKQPRLNTMLVEAYENHAKKLVEQGKKVEGAQYYEKIPALYTNSMVRKRVQERASNLRFEAGRAEMLEYFNKTAKPKLVAEDRYDAENKLIIFDIKQDVAEVEKYYAEKQNERVRLNIKDEKQRGIIQQFAIREKLKPALISVVVEATGISPEADFSKLASPKGFEIVKVEPGRRDLSITAQVPLDAVLKVGSDVREKMRQDAAAAKQKAAPGDKPAEGQGADEAKQAEAEKAAPTE
ncbi:hypothetical protein DFR33_101602 [Bradymonas sediminis]|nr:hypothetical protein DFR33_101602 [Bradymonas sediminis]